MERVPARTHERQSHDPQRPSPVATSTEDKTDTHATGKPERMSGCESYGIAKQRQVESELSKSTLIHSFSLGEMTGRKRRPPDLGQEEQEHANKKVKQKYDIAPWRTAQHNQIAQKALQIPDVRIKPHSYRKHDAKVSWVSADVFEHHIPPMNEQSYQIQLRDVPERLPWILA